MDERLTNKVLLGLYAHAQEQEPDEFCRIAFRALKQVLPFDSAVIGEGHLLADGTIRGASLHLHNQPFEKWRDYESLKGLDLAARMATANGGRPLAFASELIPRSGDQGRLRDYVEKYDVAHSLMLFAPTLSRNEKAARRIRGVSLWRAKANQDYSVQEQRLGAHVFGHLMRARELNQSHALLEHSGLGETDMTLIADRGGRVIACDFLCSKLLGTEWPDWHSPELPHALMEALRSSPQMTFVGKFLKVFASRLGSHLVLHLQSAPVMKGLTLTESVVAQMIARPMSYKEAAIQLQVSPATVRNHLHAVYVKLGLRNKGELVAFVARRRYP